MEITCFCNAKRNFHGQQFRTRNELELVMGFTALIDFNGQRTLDTYNQSTTPSSKSFYEHLVATHYLIK